MSRLPKLIPISDLRARQAEILAGLAEGPVILTQHSKGAAVLMAIDHYERLLTMIEDLEDALDAAESRQDAGAMTFDEYLSQRGERVPT
jgi:prevent-host-death family protein